MIKLTYKELHRQLMYNPWNGLFYRKISNSNNVKIFDVAGVLADTEKTRYLQIGLNKKVKNLGRYEDFDDAVCARLAAEQCVGWEGCDSCSPAYLYVKENIL